VQLQDIEDTETKAQHTAILHFKQWLKRAGLMEASSRVKKQLTQPFTWTQSRGCQTASKVEAYYRFSARQCSPYQKMRSPA
jgi:hypothetical protein